MIVVDIGNSGLRAASIADSFGKTESLLQELDVFKLSWSAIGSWIQKTRPQTVDSTHERWCTPDDEEALRWLVHSVDTRITGQTSSWRIASVHREVRNVVAKVLKSELPSAEVRWITHEDIPISPCIDHPEKVGIDRLLAARAARHLLRWNFNYQGPAIVVQAGTALTVDWIEEEDRFMGGAILPGVGLSLQYMAAGTDQLPWLPSDLVRRAPPLPGKNTEQAIAAGVHASVVGGAKYLIDRYRAGQSVPVVISGGDGQLLREEIAQPVHFQKHLVLLGLALPMTP